MPLTRSIARNGNLVYVPFLIWTIASESPPPRLSTQLKRSSTDSIGLPARALAIIVSLFYRSCSSSTSFAWDTVDSILHSSPGFVLHGVACLAVFGFSFVSPF